MKNFKSGDWVVFRKQKTSNAPGPRAQQTIPAGKGDTYNYLVDKYWVVEDTLDDGQVALRTRRGKQHVVVADNPRLRKASWWECLIFASRYRAIDNPRPTAGMSYANDEG